MKLIQNRLWLEFGELVESGVPRDTITSAKKNNSNSWVFMDDPADARKVLIDYEELKEVYKDKVLKRFGNPYERVARKPILDMVVADVAAEAFYREMGRMQGQEAGGSGSAGLTMTGLPRMTQLKYCRAAGWLGMLGRIDKQSIKKDLGLSVADFYTHVGQLVAVEKERGKMGDYQGLDVLPANFPGTYQRLMEKVKSWVALMALSSDEAYRSLVDAAWGNKNAAKLGKVEGPSTGLRVTEGQEQEAGFQGQEAGAGGRERSEVASFLAMTPVNGTITMGNGHASGMINGVIRQAHDDKRGGILPEIVPNSANKVGGFDRDLYDKQMAVIRACCEKHNNLDAGQVMEMVNFVFGLNGWKTVSIATVRKIIKENAATMTAARRGLRVHNSTIAMQVKRKVTEIPMVYWTLDGWTVELSFQERGAKSGERVQYKRMVVVVVLDAWQKYPIGYAIGERETPELIKEANRNALLHARELFGEVYRPVQVQSDNYQIKNLTPFYQALTHLHTPAAVGNAKAKVIEPYFRYLNKQYCQKLHNWTGFNINASKKNQVNVEYANKIKNTFPDKAGVIKQIVAIMEEERRGKQAEYVANWPLLPEDRKYKMSVTEWLEVFGEAVGSTNRVTGEGLVKQIDGVKYVYDSFDPAFRAHMHLDWQIVADRVDLTKVLAISPDGRRRHLLEQKHVVPMDVMSTTDADRAYLQQIKDYNDAREAEITELYGRNADTMREVLGATPFDLTDDNALKLKMMFTMNGQQKEGLQDAKGLGIEGQGFQGQEADGRGRKQIAGAGAGAERSSSFDGAQDDRLTVTKKELKAAAADWQALQDARMNEVVDFSMFTS